MNGFIVEKDILVTERTGVKRKRRFLNKTKCQIRGLRRKIRLRFQMLIWDVESLWRKG